MTGWVGGFFIKPGPISGDVICERFPNWMLWLFRKRDAAHIKVKELFYQAIAQRRAAGGQHEDLLQSLLDATYKLVLQPVPLFTVIPAFLSI